MRLSLRWHGAGSRTVLVVAGWIGGLGAAMLPVVPASGAAGAATGPANMAYVVSYTANSVIPLNLATSPPTVEPQVPVGNGPDAIAITPDGSTAYVVNQTDKTVTPIDLTTSPPAPGPAIAVGTAGTAIAISPDGARAYVVTPGAGPSPGGIVTPIDLTTSPPTPLAAINLSATPSNSTSAIAISPDGTLAYVVAGGTILVINLPSGTFGPPISLHIGSPTGVVFGPDGARSYFSEGLGYNVPVVATASASVVGSVVGGQENVAVAVSPTGTVGYVADMNGGVVIPFNPATDKAGTGIAEPTPLAMEFTADGSRLAVLNAQDNTCGQFGGPSVAVVDPAAGTSGPSACVGGQAAIAVSPGPSVARVSPDAGPAGGGTAVTVTGSGFVSGATTVAFGAQPGTGVDVTSPSTLTVVAPASSPPGTTPAVDVRVTTAAGTSAASDVDRFSYGRPTAYVVDQTSGDVTPVLTSRSPQLALPPVAIGGSPVAAALSAHGSVAYVVDSQQGTVTPVDTSTNAARTPIAVAAGIDAIALTPDGRLAIVADGSTGTATAIELTTSPPLVLPSIAVGGDPVAVAFSPNGRTAFVACNKSGKVVPLDLSSGGPVAEAPIAVGIGPDALAFTPDGSTLLVVDSNGPSGAGSVLPIPMPLGTAAPGGAITVGKGADAIAVTPDGTTAYVADRLDDAVTPIDLATGAPSAPITVGSSPSGVAISADGSVAEVTNADGNDVTPISLPSGTPQPTVAVGTHPLAVVTTPGPVVLTTTPAQGSTTGGTQVAISGNGFTPGTEVLFGSTPASGIAVDSGERLTADTPPGTGTVSVTVVTAQGTSAVITTAQQYTYLAPSRAPLALVTDGASSVAPWSTYTNLPGSPVTVGKGASGIAITPDRSMAYVADSTSGTVTPIALTTTPPAAEPPFDVCPGGATTCGPSSIAVTPDGTWAIVVLYVANEVVPVNLETRAVGTPIPMPGQQLTGGYGPVNVVAAPDGRTAYVLTTGPSLPQSNFLVRLNLSGGSWSADPAGPAVMPADVSWLALSPDGTTAYIADGAGSVVYIANLTTDPPTLSSTSVSVSAPRQIAITPDGTRAYVANGGRYVTPIDLVTDKAGPEISMSEDDVAAPNAIAITPDGGTVYVAASNIGQVTPIATATDTPGTPMQVRTSQTSTIVISTPVTVPNPPRSLVAQPGYGKIAVSWAPPFVDGGSPVTSYTVTVTGPGAPGPITVAVPTTSTIVTGLTNYDGYRVAVIATNLAGDSAPATTPVPVDPQITRGDFVPLPPDRILDTRDGNGTGGVVAPLGPGKSLALQVAGRAGVPSSGAAAVVMNVTAVDATIRSYITVSPAGQARPLASNLNFGPGQAIPNSVTVELGTSGQVDVYNRFGDVDVIADVVGWYTDGTTLAYARYSPLPPVRILDTRAGAGSCTPSPCAPLGARASLTLSVAGHGGVPVGAASAVVVNVTAAGSSAGSYLTVYPTGQARPLASNLNFTAGETIPNLVTAKLGAGGAVTIYNNAGTVNVIADVVGWYSTDGSLHGSRFTAITPARVLDTRLPTGTCSPAPCATLGPGGSLILQVTGIAGSAPAGAVAAVMNVTVADATGRSYLTVYPADVAQPLASNLNFVAGSAQPNLVISALGAPGGSSAGEITIYNNAGTVDVIVDISGWFNDGTT